MPASQTRSQTVRENLGLRIEPSPYSTHEKVLITPHTPQSARASLNNASSSRCSTPGSDVFLFSVLCMYDFSSDDHTHLSFEKNEILEILQCTDSGWWAAMRLGGETVGWIPKGYVAPLGKSLARRLRTIRPELRVYEFEFEELSNYPPVARSQSAREPASAVPSLESPRTSTKNSPSTLRPVAEASLRRRNTNPHLNASYSPQPRPNPYPPPSSSSPVPPLPSPSPLAQRHHRPSVPQDVTEDGRARATPMSGNKSTRRKHGTEETGALSLLTNVLDNKTTTRDTQQKYPSTRADGAPKFSFSREPISQSAGQSSQDPSYLQQTIIISRSPDSVPWYLRPQYADQLELDPRGHVRSGTLVALVEKLTTEAPANDTAKIAESTAYTGTFLLTFRTMMTANRFFEMLLDRFYVKPPKGLTDSQKKDWKINYRDPTQGRVLDIFGLWLEDHHLLEEEPHISQRLTEFLTSINTLPHNTRAAGLLQTLERLTFRIPAPAPVPPTTPSKKARKSKVHKNDLLKVDPADIAEQLTLLEYSLYSKITAQECLRYAEVQDGPSVCRLVEFCKTHDRLNGWVKASILNHEVLGKRADTIDFWIRVAEKCRGLSNFSSMSAILVALSSSAIERLHLTWSHVGRRAHFETLLQFNQPNGGFSGYRGLMREAEGPCVPFITMYLTEIVRARVQFPVEEGRISFHQRIRWQETVNNLLRFQSRPPYKIPFGDVTTAFIENHLKEGGSKDQEWFWNKSAGLQRFEVAHADIRKGLDAAGF